MEDSTKTRINILSCIKEYANDIKTCVTALVGGNDEKFIGDIDSIPELTDYKNKNYNDEDIKKDIDNLEKIQKALDKKKEQARKAKKNLDRQLDGSEIRSIGKNNRIMDREEKEY